MARLIHGDALAVLPTLDEGSVDAVITDPPYSSGGQFRGDRVLNLHTKYVQSGSVSGKALAPFSGDNRDQRSHLRWSALWMADALRATKPGGIIAVFTDWRQLPTTTDAIQIAGWIWRGVLAWHKPNGRRTQGRFANNCEYVVWGTNGPRPLNALPAAPDGFVQANTPRDRQHITQKPLTVMQHLVSVCPEGGTVLDPFMGSGTTGVAAELEGRDFIGIELSPHYVQVARSRISQPPTAAAA